MSLSPRTARWASLVLLTATLAGACALARAQGSPVPGGTVPSLLGLSLSEPSGFKRLRTSHGISLYGSLVRAEVTATDVPIRLSVSDGEASAHRRHGHLVNGPSVLPAPLQVAVDHGPFRSLGARVAPALKFWSEPLAGSAAKIHLRQVAANGHVLRNHHKLLLITLTAGGP
jgi:hypothetical protein